MNMHTTTTSDDNTRYPETVGECPEGDGEEQDDTRRLAPDAEVPDPEEAGYGYGV